MLNLNLSKTQMWILELDSETLILHMHSRISILFLCWPFHLDILQCGIWFWWMTHVTFLFYFNACCLCYTQTPQLLWFPQPENIVLALKVNCALALCSVSLFVLGQWLVLSLLALSVLPRSFPCDGVSICFVYVISMVCETLRSVLLYGRVGRRKSYSLIPDPVWYLVETLGRLYRTYKVLLLLLKLKLMHYKHFNTSSLLGLSLLLPVVQKIFKIPLKY